MAGPEIQTPTSDVSPQECDAHLGAYLRAFDQIELTLFQLFAKLLDAPLGAAHILYHSGMTAQTIREVIVALANLRLDKAMAHKVQILLEGPVKKATTKRNRIVHANWQIKINVERDKAGKVTTKSATWIRHYTPTDPSIYDKMYGKRPDQKATAAHNFDLKAIEEALANAVAIARNIQNITSEVQLRPYVQPQPLDIS